MVTIENHIEAELTRLGLYFKVGHREIRLRCPWHGGLTLDLNRESGLWRCWNPDCGQRGHWDKLADKIGGKKLDPSKIDAFAAMAASMARSNGKGASIPMLPPGCIPWDDRPWRGLSGELLRRVNAQWWYDDDFFTWRVLLPITVQSKLVGYTARREDNDDTVKWRHSKGIDALGSLYPFDMLSPGYPVVVLVEGPHDALTLWQHGIPALAALGAGQWSTINTSMVLGKGVTNIVIMGDGDSAGEGFQSVIEKQMKDYCNLYSIRPPDGMDPGDMGPDWLLWVREQVERLYYSR